MEDKIVKTITVFVPGSMCNLRCHYCYVSQCLDESHLEKPSYDYPLETMIKAFSKKRLGGLAEITVISNGETLMDDTIIPFIHGLLKEGHVVTLVTNLTLNNKIDQLLDFPQEYLKRLIVKGSLHWLELKRTNKVDDYFNNMKKVLSKGASSYPFLVLSEDYMKYVDEILETCKEKIGTTPHCTPNFTFDEKTDLKRGGAIKTSPGCTKEFVDYVDKNFDSRIFDACVKYIDIDPKKTFCYAGDWSFNVSLKDGAMKKCHGCKPEANFYENLDKLPKLSPIGTNCQIASCALQYNFVAQGLLPDAPQVDTYGKMIAKPGIINDEVVNLLDFRYTDDHRQLSKKEQEKINKKVNEFYELSDHRYKYKIMYKIWKYLDSKLKRKGIII